MKTATRNKSSVSISGGSEAFLRGLNTGVGRSSRKWEVRGSTPYLKLCAFDVARVYQSCYRSAYVRMARARISPYESAPLSTYRKHAEEEEAVIQRYVSGIESGVRT